MIRGSHRSAKEDPEAVAVIKKLEARCQRLDRHVVLLSRACELAQGVLGDGNHAEFFDKLAEEFRRATGMMAPGKDVALAAGSFGSFGSDQERRDKWADWKLRRLELAQQALRDALKEVTCT